MSPDIKHGIVAQIASDDSATNSPGSSTSESWNSHSLPIVWRTPTPLTASYLILPPPITSMFAPEASVEALLVNPSHPDNRPYHGAPSAGIARGTGTVATSVSSISPPPPRSLAPLAIV